ncbi:hypothetical protein A6C57_16865 [Fibrella sp. ES10-3-2-2]|nr:hypothetical protein A6C57_16865 [Fibrella sp. ES10-3-2-2]
MAGSVPLITANSITTITGLRVKPIYFVTLNGQAQPSLVIKGENMLNVNNNDALVSITWTSKLMKNVNNHQVNVKLMTPTEITEFLRAGNATFAANSDEAYHLGGQYNWVKMPNVAGLSDTEIWPTTSATPEAKRIKAVIIKLMQPHIWYELGKVVAVDIFNGNNDRFNSNGDWVNKGNIMFVNNSVIGMDTWDPSGTNGGNMESNLVQGGGFQALTILTDLFSRHEFAVKATASVGLELSNGLKRSGTNSVSVRLTDNSIISVDLEQIKTLFDEQVTEFKRGLLDGATQLRAYLQSKVNQYDVSRRAVIKFGVARGGVPINQGSIKRIPKGVLDRMNFLGW